MIDISIEQLNSILLNAYCYDKFGKVISLWPITFDRNGIHGKIGKKTLHFKWCDVGVKVFSSKEDCELKAQKYINKVTECMSLNTLRRICRLKPGRTFYHFNENLGHVYPDEVGEFNYFDKQNLTWYNSYEYDDDWGGGTVTEEYPLRLYGITWGITKKEVAMRGKINE